jgi:hypothetical protein
MIIASIIETSKFPRWFVKKNNERERERNNGLL